MRARKHSFSRWFRNTADDNAAAAPRSDAVHAAVMETLESRRLLSAGLVPRQPPLPMATTSFFFPRRPPKPPAAPAAPARAEADALSASAARVTWLDQSSNEQGFRIDAAERRKPFKPVATAAPNATAVVVHDLKADTPYTFRVSALGNGSKSRAATTTGEPLTLELMSGEVDPLETDGWFKFTLPGSSTPTLGEAAFSATGSLQAGTDWYYGFNWREAAFARGALTGTITVDDPYTNTSHDWAFGSGPFRVGTGAELEKSVREALPPDTPADSSLRFELPADNTKLVVLDDQWSDPDRDYDDFYWTLGVEKLTPNLVLDGRPEESQPPPHEMDPGAFINLNEDDDDANGTEDKDTSGAVTGENDLVQMDLILPASFTSGSVELNVTAGGDKVKVWQSQQKDANGPIIGGADTGETWLAGAQPATVWVEGIERSERATISFELAARPAGAPVGAPAATDVAKAGVFRINFLIAFHGAGPPGFGNQWLRQIAIEANAKADLYGSEDKDEAMKAFITEIDRDGDQKIEQFEITPLTLRVLGYSRGTISACNFTHSLRQATTEVIPWYELEAAIPVKTLVTLDPETGGFDEPRGASSNVVTFHNYWQGRGDSSRRQTRS